jgi:hypothetical protein
LERAAKSAVFGRKWNAQQVVLREELLDVPRELAGGVDLRGARRNLLSHDVADDLEDQIILDWGGVVTLQLCRLP